MFYLSGKEFAKSRKVMNLWNAFDWMMLPIGQIKIFFKKFTLQFPLEAS